MSKKAEKNKNPRFEYGRVPNRIVYGLAYYVLKFVTTRIFRARFHVDPRIKTLPRPFIVLGNHTSYIDPFMVGCALYPQKINYLAAANFFRNKKLRPLLYVGGLIPKTQFRADPAAIKAMLKTLKRGGVLGIFPEGARSIDGTSLPIEGSITKFIKKSGGAVVIASSRGSYLSWPRWSTSGIRRGKIQFDLQLLFTKEEVEAMPDSDLQSAIVQALATDEYAWQEKAMIPFSSKAPARGLHTILHQCPACKERWVMDTTDTSLFCKACGNTAVMDVYGFLRPQNESSAVFKTVSAWNHWQLEDLRAECAADGFFLEEEADLYLSEGRDVPYHLAGNGTVCLDRGGFTFRGILQGTPVEKVFPLAGILGISSDFGSNFDLVSDQSTSKLYLKNGQKVITFSHAVHLLREMRSDAPESGSAPQEP